MWNFHFIYSFARTTHIHHISVECASVSQLTNFQLQPIGQMFLRHPADKNIFLLASKFFIFLFLLFK